MSTETNAKDEAQKIWERLDAEDRGDATPPADDESSSQRDDGTAQAAPEPKQDTQAQDNADDKLADYELEDDPRALRNKIAGLEAMVNQLGGRLRNAEGHIGGLNSQVKQQLEAAKQVAKTGAEAPGVREISEAQSSPEAMAQLERDYPEFAKALKPTLSKLDAQLAELQKPAEVKQVQAQAGVSREELEVMRAEMRIESKHPGWQEKVQSPEFVGWLSNSPREAKLLAASDDPQDAIRLLDLFNANKQTQAKEPPQRLKSAAVIPSGRRSEVRTKNVDDMTPQEFWRYMDTVDSNKAKA